MTTISLERTFGWLICEVLLIFAPVLTSRDSAFERESMRNLITACFTVLLLASCTSLAQPLFSLEYAHAPAAGLKSETYAAPRDFVSPLGIDDAAMRNLHAPAPQSTPRANVPSFTSSIQKAGAADAFESFIENHRGSIVHLNFEASVRFSKIAAKYRGEIDFFVSSDVCGASTPPSECNGDHYMLSGSDFTLRYYADNNILNGYFFINEDVEMHQGRYYKLKAIPAEQVLLRSDGPRRPAINKEEGLRARPSSLLLEAEPRRVFACFSSLQQNRIR